MTRATLLACLVALCGTSPSLRAAPPAAPRYSVTDLGTLGGGQSLATGINNKGQVVGTSSLPGDGLAHGFLFSYDPAHPPASPPTAPLKDLGTLGGGNSNARAINGAGQIVGYAETGAVQNGRTVSHAFLSSGAGLTDLGALGGGVISVAFGLEGSAPRIAGGSETVAVDALGDPVAHAFYTDGLAALQDLGVLPGYNDSSAYGVSAGGRIVGSSFDGDGTLSQATLFTPGGSPVGLGTLAGGSLSDAYAATDTVAVGDSDDATGTYFPVLFDLTTPGSKPLSLGLLPGYAGGVAYGLNAAGSVVGIGYNGTAATGAARHGFLRVGGTLYDLNGLLSAPSAADTVLEAFTLNDYGQIAGDGLDASGALHAFLISPTPQVTGLAPSSAVPNFPFALTVTGSNFAPDAVVYFNGIPEATVFVSPTQVTANIPDVGVGSAAVVDVGTPTPSGSGQTLLIGLAQISVTFSSLTIDAAAGQYVYVVTFTNNGTVPATNVRLTLGTLRSGRPVTAPAGYVSAVTTGTGTVAPNASQTVTLRFPRAALPAGARQALAQVQYTFTGGPMPGEVCTTRAYANPPQF